MSTWSGTDVDEDGMNKPESCFLVSLTLLHYTIAFLFGYAS